MSIAGTACSDHTGQANDVDSSTGKALTLYYHRADGVVAGYVTPGILNCDPQIASIHLSRHLEMRRHEPIDWRRPLPQKEEREQEEEELRSLLKSTFLPLRDADWREGEYYTAQEIQRSNSAIRFARQHNQAAFQTGKKQILRLCPRAQAN
jgi:hypothetical protein